MKLAELKRFVNSNNKIPICKWKDKNNWLTYDEALKNAKEKNLGISIVLGKIDDEYTLAGIDYDTVRDKNTGLVDKDIYFETKPFKHIHKSLSGYGIHILCLVNNNVKLLNGMKKFIDIKTPIVRCDENNNLKHSEVEFYTEDKLFVIPIDNSINPNEDNIIDSTEDYINLYKKYFGNIKKTTNSTKIDESKKDFVLILNAIKKGLTKEEIYQEFMTSDYANSKDDKHKEKLYNRKDYFDRTYNKAMSYLDKPNKIDEINNNDELGRNKTEALINLLIDKTLFIDERNIAYIVIDNQNIKVDSNKFERLLVHLSFENNLKISQQAIKYIQSYFEYKAEKDNNKVNLNVRFADYNNDYYYQLSENKLIKMNYNGYEVVSNDFPLFRWTSTMEDQVEPIKNDGFKYIMEMLSFFNIEKEQRLLFLVYVVSLFIPNIPKPILILQAEKGAGKTTATKLLKSLIDPSKIEATYFPRNEEALSQLLDHSALINFDNLNRLQDWQSDALCRAYSGETYTKRSLFTDDEDFIFKYKRAIILNGINCPAIREDLLDRSIIINLKRIETYKEESLIYKEWNEKKPYILDNIFKLISLSLQIYYNTHLDNLGRTADWCKWGYCIAKALGNEINKPNLCEIFINDWKKNENNQNKEAIENNIVAQCIIKLMNNKNSWQGTASELYKDLLFISEDFGSNGFPKNSSWLTREINKLISVLKSQGINIITGKSINKGSLTIIEKK